MFQFPTFAPLPAVISLQLIGLPHSDIHGSIRICQSPWLFAACHVLLRLQEPRHPPYTLSNFSRSLLYVSSCQRSLLPISGFRTRLSFFRVLFFVLGVQNYNFFHNYQIFLSFFMLQVKLKRKIYYLFSF